MSGIKVPSPKRGITFGFGRFLLDTDNTLSYELTLYNLVSPVIAINFVRRSNSAFIGSVDMSDFNIAFSEVSARFSPLRLFSWFPFFKKIVPDGIWLSEKFKTCFGPLNVGFG